MWRRGIAIAVTAAAALAPAGTALAASGQQISVNGTGGAIVPDEATDTQQQTAYDQALTAAIGDAQAKAQMVAQQLALTLGPVQTFTEESDDYLGYCGVGFLPGAVTNSVSGSASTPTAATPNGQLTPIPAKPKKHKAKKKAHKAQNSENTCQVEADVTVVYSTM
ncbi:MAG: SIMPL domain-containing protein [Solirubrobacteraceae bacterium]